MVFNESGVDDLPTCFNTHSISSDSVRDYFIWYLLTSISCGCLVGLLDDWLKDMSPLVGLLDASVSLIIRPSRLGQQNTPIAYLQRVKAPTNECPRYDTKQSDC